MMKRHKVMCAIILVINFFCCSLSLASFNRQELDPEVPWENDPDISTIQDERILQLWDKVVKGYRRKCIHPREARKLYQDNNYTSITNIKDDQLYLLNAFEKELKKEDINWNSIFAIQLIMLAGMDTNSKIPELADYLFKLERPHKMSQVHGLAYLTMMDIIGLQQSNEAANLLFTAANDKYWGESPMLSPFLSKESTAKSICCLRQTAVIKLSKISISICAPYFNNLMDRYPIPSDYEEVFNHLAYSGTSRPLIPEEREHQLR